LNKWELATASSAGERLERYCFRLFVARSILLLVYGVGARLDVTEGEWRCGKKRGPRFKMTWRFNDRENPFLFLDTMLELIHSGNLEYKNP
jgi:hypothetical protein